MMQLTYKNISIYLTEKYLYRYFMIIIDDKYNKTRLQNHYAFFFFTKYTIENARYANCHFDYHDVMVTTFCKSSLNQFKSD